MNAEQMRPLLTQLKIGEKKVFLNLAMSGASYYPLDEEPEEKLEPTSIQLTKEMTADLEFIAELWNEFDRVRKIPRRHKWKPSTVIRHLLTVGIKGFAVQIGGMPRDEDGRKEYLRQAKPKIEALASKFKK